MLQNNFTRKLTQFKNPSGDQSPSGYMQYANQALSMIERNNEISDFSPTKYPSQKAGKSVKRNAPGTAIVKNAKGILLDKKARISRATTTQQQEVRSATNNDSFQSQQQQ